MTRSGERLPHVVLAVVVAALDYWTKSLVRGGIPLHQERLLVEGLLSLRHGRNPGLAFGLLSRAGLPYQSILLALVGLAALSLLAFYLLRLPARPRLPGIGLALMLGGAAGNLAERLTRGYVTDFVHVFHGAWQWHDFNLADVALTVGVGLFVLAGFQRR